MMTFQPTLLKYKRYAYIWK